MANADIIDPQIVAARQLQAAAVPGLDVMRLPVAQGRALANQAARMLNDGNPALARVEERAIATRAGALRARIYQADRSSTAGLFLYVHGGGWFACDVDTHDRMLRVLAKLSGLTIVGFDYRLAPEHPYPAALEDTQDVWRWALNVGVRLRVPTGHVVLGGDSAGANLALSLTLAERDSGRVLPAGLVLLYGCFAPGIETASQRRYGTGPFGLTTERMGWYWSNYLGAAAASPPPLATPLHADLKGMPPTFVGIAELDILADENRLLAERLAGSGVSVRTEVWPGTTHGFLQMTRDVAIARSAVRTIATVSAQLAKG